MSHVKGHYRNIDGKLVWVADHEREGAAGVHLHNLFDDWDAPAPAAAPEPAPQATEAPAPQPKAIDLVPEPVKAGTVLDEGMAAPTTEDDLTKDHFHDVGKKIGGAQKDIAALKAKYFNQHLAVSLDDLESLEAEPELAHLLITKEQQLGSKAEFIQSMKNGGASPGACYIGSRLWTAIGEPVDTPAGRKQFALGLKRVQEAVMNWKTLKDAANGIGQLSDETVGFWMPADIAAEKGVASDAYTAAKKKVNTMNAAGLYGGYVWGPASGIKAKTPEAQAAYDEFSAAHKGFYGKLNGWQKASEAHPSNPMLQMQALGKKFEDQVYKSDRKKSLLEKAISIEKEMSWAWAEKNKVAEGESGEKPKKASKHSWKREVPEEIEKVGGVDSQVFVAQSFKDQFGFNGVEYGNWMDLDSSQHHTQACGEALADFADILGVTPQEMSLNGRLSIAFGARGKGKAAAHYEPAKKVINLTRWGGGGSLAHEWGHALDNILSMVSTGGQSHQMMMMSDNAGKQPGTELPAEVTDAMQELHKAMHTGTTQLYKMSTLEPEAGKAKATLNYTGKQILAQFDGDAQKAVDHYATKLAHLKSYKPKLYTSRLRKAAQLFANASGQPVTLKTPKGDPVSNFAATASEMGEYWGRRHEMFARAWEGFVSDKLESAGRKNTYLVSGASEKSAEYHASYDPVLEHVGGVTSVYPRGEERQKINAAFEKLVTALKTHKIYAKAIQILAAMSLFD
jgi:hypothetical protein